MNDLDDDRRGLISALGYDFSDPALLEQALRHRSWCAENGAVESNERLEFLGDSVLGLVVTDRLYLDLPDLPEGQLAQRRAALVNSRTLAAVAGSVELGAHLRLGRGEIATGGQSKASILADGFEAVLAGVYLDGGIVAATEVINRLMAPWIDEVVAGVGVGDAKSQLQELAARFELVPTYELAEDGPDHAKRFTARVFVGSLAGGDGVGHSKKEAEQAAATVALVELHRRAQPDAAQRDAAESHRRNPAESSDR